MNTKMIRIIMLLFVTTYVWGFSSLYINANVLNGMNDIPEVPKDKKLENIYDIL